MRKRLFSALLMLTLCMSTLPPAAWAAEANDIGSADVTIDEGGAYVFSDIDTTHSLTITSGAGSVDLTLKDVTINAEDGAAIHIEAGATLNLNLEGTNTLTGSAGYAAICVEPAYDQPSPDEWVYLEDDSAVLHITGSGSLTAIGGGSSNRGYGGGAGIGGNGENKGENPVDFGTITIAEDFTGKITATGGDGPSTGNYGAGAGIGSGGTWYNWGEVFGTVNIHNGTVEATGGMEPTEMSDAGGAGIGGGGSYSNQVQSYIYINILGGDITATGGTTAAGIGGGSNCDGGYILIDGATVKAYATNNDGSFAGAGIGGGDNSAFGDITISGGANVYAIATGSAAGIGSGNDSQLGTLPDATYDITIEGENTYVESYGGSAGGKYGGAGIGVGSTVDKEHEFATKIYIRDRATVYAYGGYHSQGIGYGFRSNNSGTTNYYGNSIKLFLDDSITLWSVNTDYHAPALVAERTGEGKDVIDIGHMDYVSADRYLLTYTQLDDTNTPDPRTSGEAVGSLIVREGFQTSYPNNADLTWNLDGELMRFDFLNAIVMDVEPLFYPFSGEKAVAGSDLHGNWATLYPPLVSVDYEFVGEGPDNITPPEREYIQKGSEYTAKEQEEPSDGSWTFDGWYTDDSCSSKWVDETAVSEDMTLYGKWIPTQITIRKTVTGEEGDTEKDFHFTLTLDDEAVDGTHGDLLFTGGSAEFTLTDGDMVTAKAVPANTTYTVTEEEANADGYVTTISGGETGTTTKGETIDVEFINNKEPAPPVIPDPEPTGKLVVKKTVTGTDRETDRAFHFEAVIGDISYTFTLKDGEEWISEDFTEGTAYAVMETEANTDGYITTVVGDVEGTVSADKDTVVSFINNRDKQNTDEPKEPGGDTDDPAGDPPGGTDPNEPSDNPPGNTDPDDPTDNPSPKPTDPSGDMEVPGDKPDTEIQVPTSPEDGDSVEEPSKDYPSESVSEDVTEEASEEAPQTGDTANVLFWLTLSLISAAGIGILVVVMRRKKK